jgi:hypothetical protein
MKRAALVAALLCLASPAAADEWHAGGDFHTGLGVHLVRVGGGVQIGRLDLTALVDPLVVLDGQHDLDLRAVWRPTPARWGFVGGVRVTTLAIDDGTRVYDKLLVGAEAPLPTIAGLRAYAGVEMAVTLLEHGAGLPTEHYEVSGGRWFWERHDFGMYLRVEYAAGL